LSETHARVLNSLTGRQVDVPSRRIFRAPGSLGDEVIFVIEGLLSLYCPDSRGQRQIVALRYPGEELIPPEFPATFGIQALIPSKVFLTPKVAFEAEVQAHTELQLLFRQRAERHTAIGYEWLVNNSRRDASARTAHFLCETAVRLSGEQVAGGLDLPFTQEQIGEITGQTSVSVNRILKEIELAGLIRREGRRLDFPDWAELGRLANFQPDYLT
jgi:CRP-like cAMP-binding protein